MNNIYTLINSYLPSRATITYSPNYDLFIFKELNKNITRDQLNAITFYKNNDLYKYIITTYLPKIEQVLEPFDPLGDLCMTPVQQLITNWMTYYKYISSICVIASCGSGKTIAGLILMSKLRCKTLIISARTAVNDQWSKALESLNVNKNMYKVVTPQYLTRGNNMLKEYEWFNTCGLVIYDEIHSLCTNEFIKVLYPHITYTQYKHPLTNTFYKLGLTATMHPSNTVEYKLCESACGPIIRPDPPTLLKTPVNYCLIPKNNKLLQSLSILEDLYKCNPMIFNGPNKCLIMFANISITYLFCEEFVKRFKHPILNIRALNEKSHLVDKDGNTFYISSCDVQECLNNVNVICGTTSRLKEGFNCPTITWGIIADYLWSNIARVQMLGRYRRTTDEPCKSLPRVIFVLYTDFVETYTTPTGFVIEKEYNHALQDANYKYENYVERDYNTCKKLITTKFRHDVKLGE